MNSFLQGIPYNPPCLQNKCLQGFAVASIDRAQQDLVI